MKHDKSKKLLRPNLSQPGSETISGGDYMGAHEISRRDFVKSTFAMTSGLAVPAGLTGASIGVAAASPDVDKTPFAMTLIEPSKKIPVFDEVDVVVCGGGPA